MVFSIPRRRGGDISAIIVHAGAGYHSMQNERIHLQACDDAANMAMAILKNGGSAVDAVTAAITVLEDREITNSGYGSNLTLEGTVECDASVVDHLGRSGAVGAVSQIKNPIQLARLVLQLSNQPLSLRRVPPNLVVGQGATDFAFEHGMAVLPHHYLVSPAARERWLRWKADLRKAEKGVQEGSEASRGSEQSTGQDNDYEEGVRRRLREEHTRAMAAAVWNESQAPPISSLSQMETTTPLSQSLTGSFTDAPLATISFGQIATNSDHLRAPFGRPPGSHNGGLSESRHGRPDASPYDLNPHSQGRDGTASLKTDPEYSEDMTGIDDGLRYQQREGRFTARQDGSSESDSWTCTSTSTLELPSASPSPPPYAAVHTALPPSPPEGTVESPSHPLHTPFEYVMEAPPLPPDPIGGALGPTTDLYGTINEHAYHVSPLPPPNTPRTSTPLLDLTEDRADLIMDTVGAIAVDSYGNIAAGSSSGGIGMKHRGRTGPAALVGVGSAVKPIDPDDRDKTCVGVVTSGTGEHMATTMAAGTCADRLFASVRKRKGGGLEVVDEDHCIRGVIERDFMDHPSVTSSQCIGAIGLCAVKKTKDGVFFYFAHNTDSFALASMHSDELRATCTMSRSLGNGIVAQGGRAARYQRKK